MSDFELSDGEGRKALEPKPYVARKTKKRICVYDTETDPFAEDRVVAPFTVGFYDGECYFDFWGDDCIDQFFTFLKENYADQELLIYAHNGGRFDFYFQLDYLDRDQEPFIMQGRIVSAKFGGQEFRDSYKIIPSPLAGYQKEEIDYNKFERGEREKHKREILAYQKTDCLYLYDLVSSFHEMFGDKLTIGSTALPVLRSFHDYRLLTAKADENLRPYYYGGRCQAFETGIMRAPLGSTFKVYDRNSMYPAAMREELHPVGFTYTLSRDITDKTAFLLVEGWNDGAFPMRVGEGENKGSLDFTVRRGKFWITIHEYRAAVETGTFKTQRIVHARNCDEWDTFAGFVDHYYNARLEAKAADDKIRDLFYKLLLNSAYGKFAQDPSEYESFMLRDAMNPPDREEMRSPENEGGWYPATVNRDLFVWARPSPHAWRSYKNVGIAASITGAARANLLRNLALAKRPMYCDTDSIICESFTGETDDKRLGGWKLEATGHVVAIAGKKMYCVLSYDQQFQDKLKTIPKPHDLIFDGRKAWVIKLASKGAKLTAEQIIALCRGQTVLYKNPVPNFKLDGSAEFVHRNIKAT